MQISEKGIALIKRYEGCVLYAYDDLDGCCPHKKTTAMSVIKGTLTIGYGHTGKDVYKGMVITQNDAELLLKSDLAAHCNFVSKFVKVPMNQNQFDALVSFEYNVGCTQFANSTLLRLLNAGNYNDAAGQFTRWKYSGGKILEGLIRRREAEKVLFLS